jgi:hypothetical protein
MRRIVTPKNMQALTIRALVIAAAAFVCPTSAFAAGQDFSWPANGTVTQNAAEHRQNEGGNSAIDIANAGANIPVVAAHDGVVQTVSIGGNAKCHSADSSSNGLGNYVVLRHDGPGGTLFTAYGHLSSASVSVGQAVTEGTQLGVMGSTGCSTGQHVHFAVATCSNIFGCTAWTAPDPPDGTHVTQGAGTGGIYGQLAAAGPPPPPDSDGDGLSDNADSCPAYAGLTALRGCPTDIAESQPVSLADFNGDGLADYCRVVGAGDGVNSHVACTVSGQAGFGATFLSPVIDWGYDVGRAWVDFNGDGKADYCRLVGDSNGIDSHVECTLSTGSGFGATVLSPVVDWGYDFGRAWVDVNGDGKADYCRVVGNSDGVSSYVECTLSTGTGFGATIVSPVIDWGYDFGRAWVDVNGDGKADYCRVVGNSDGVDSHVACTLSTGTGFGATILSPVIDWGYDLGRAWTDVNGDGKADYCRLVGASNGVDSHVACTLSTGTGFGATILSPVIDWGYETGRAWADFNGDGKADYCRVVGTSNGVSSYVECTLSTGTGFGATILSPVIDWGYDTGRAWVDFNGDGKADYCRRVGTTNGTTSYVECTASTGSAFGATTLSSVVDWGYDTGRAWVGAAHPTSPASGGPSPGGPGSPTTTQNTAGTSVIKPHGSTTSKTALHCVVPRLRHATVATAERALLHAHCRVGTVHRPRHHRRGHVLRVVGQSAPTGSTHRLHFHVGFTVR